MTKQDGTGGPPSDYGNVLGPEMFLHEIKELRRNINNIGQRTQDDLQSIKEALAQASRNSQGLGVTGLRAAGMTTIEPSFGKGSEFTIGPGATNKTPTAWPDGEGQMTKPTSSHGTRPPSASSEVVVLCGPYQQWDRSPSLPSAVPSFLPVADQRIPASANDDDECAPTAIQSQGRSECDRQHIGSEDAVGAKTQGQTEKKKEMSDEKKVPKARGSISLFREKQFSANKKKSLLKPVHKMSIAEIIKTPFFDNIVGFVILMNAVVIGVQTDYNAVNLPDPDKDPTPVAFFLFEQFFAVWFTFELSIRIYVYRIAFFKLSADGWAWNYFDTSVVLAQLLEVFFELVARSDTLNSSNFRVLRVLRILRLVRILRVVRVLHLISELRTIISSIIGSFKSLLWVVVLLLIMMYIVAVFFTQSITDHLTEARKDSSFVMSVEEDSLATYFGSLARSVLSLWQSMSGGLDWDSLAGPLYRRISWLSGFAFTSFIAFALLALMNVVTGVFVQTALNSARKEEDAFMKSQIIALFNISGSSQRQSAKVTWNEVSASLEDPKEMTEWKSIGVQKHDAQFVFNLLDVEGTGQVLFEEFMGGCLRIRGEAKAIDLLILMQENRKTGELMGQSFVKAEADMKKLLSDMSKVTSEMGMQRYKMADLSQNLASEFASIHNRLGMLGQTIMSVEAEAV